MRDCPPPGSWLDLGRVGQFEQHVGVARAFLAPTGEVLPVEVGEKIDRPVGCGGALAEFVRQRPSKQRDSLLGILNDALMEQRVAVGRRLANDKWIAIRTGPRDANSVRRHLPALLAR